MKIHLVKGRSYLYGKYIATKEKPTIDVPNDIAEYLISTGHFTSNSVTKEEKKSEPPAAIKTGFNANDSKSEVAQEFDVNKMRIEEINALAEELGVEFAAGDKKAEKIAKLNKYLNNKPEE